MFTWCRKRKADVIFLQETHSKEDSEKQWANEWGGKAFFSHDSPNSCGVAILIRNNFVIQKSIVDPQGRFIILKAGIQDKVNILVNIYAPKYNNNNIIIFVTMLFCSRRRKPKNDLLWKKTYNKYTRKQPKNSNRTLPTLT